MKSEPSNRNLVTKKEVMALIDEKIIPVWRCFDDLMQDVIEIQKELDLKKSSRRKL